MQTAGIQAVSDDSIGDDALMSATAGGDTAAFATLVERHGPRVAGLANRMLGSPSDADEVVQEAMLRLWRRAPVWQPDGARVSTWLHRVASNLCIDRLRRPRMAALDDTAEPPDPSASAEHRHDAAIAATAVARALDDLAPRQKLAIVMCHYQGMTNIEAADALDISVDALESLLARGRRVLKANLEAQREWLLEALTEGGVDVNEGRDNGTI